MPQRVRGTLSKWFDEKGYGFIAADGKPRRSVFLHYSAMSKLMVRPEEGDRLEFDLKESEKGWRAHDVIKIPSA